MLNFLKQGFLVCVICLISTRVFAQKNTLNGDANTWVFWLSKANFGKGWSVSNEFHLRQSAPFKDNANFIFRPSVDYRLNKHVEFAVGYSFIRSWPNRPRYAIMPLSEQNVWQQLLFSHTTGKVKFAHRFRQEIRFIQSPTYRNGELTVAENLDKKHRFRYRFQMSFPLFKVCGESVSMTLFEEIWMHQIDGMRPTDFNRNWFYIGLDYAVTENTSVHFGFMDQFDKVTHNTFVQQPAFQLMLNTKLFDATRTKDLIIEE